MAKAKPARKRKAKAPKAKDMRRARFVDEFMKDMNATQAAIRAGYSAGKDNASARVTGSTLLTNPIIKAQIDARRDQLARSNEITVERVLKEIARIAFGDPLKMYREDGSLKLMHEMDEDARAMIAGVESEEVREPGKPVLNKITGEFEEKEAELVITRKVKRWDKGKALEQCMGYLGMHKTMNAAQGGGGLVLNMNLSTGKRA